MLVNFQNLLLCLAPLELSSKPPDSSIMPVRSSQPLLKSAIVHLSMELQLCYMLRDPQSLSQLMENVIIRFSWSKGKVEGQKKLTYVQSACNGFNMIFFVQVKLFIDLAQAVCTKWWTSRSVCLKKIKTTEEASREKCTIRRFTSANGVSCKDISNFRHSRASLLNPAPGIQDGTYFKNGNMSTRNVPGMSALMVGSTAASAKVM